MYFGTEESINVRILFSLHLKQIRQQIKTIIQTEDVYEDFSSNKEMFDSSNYSTNSEYYDGSNKFVIAKMKDGTGGVAIEEFFGLKPKIYSFLVDYNSDSKIEKCVNRNVVATTCIEDVLLNNKCLRHSMNRIQSKDHIIETYEIKKISLSCLMTRYILEKMDMMD